MAEAEPLILRVAEARPGDTGRCLAWLPGAACRTHGLATGDIVSIEGARTTVARAVRAETGQDEGTIRIDGMTRRNARITVGGRVRVARVEARPARIIEYKNGDEQLPPAGLARLFLDLPLVAGDVLRQSAFGHPRLEIEVAATDPEGPIVVAPGTVFRPLARSSQHSIEAPLRPTYEDIGGLGRELEEIREIVELPLKHPELFSALGIRPSRGILLIGPPGTGKTLIARTVAHEVQASFFALSGPEIMRKYYGESEAQLRQLFANAKGRPPSIIFLDEIDAIAPRRQTTPGELERRVVAQLLALLDGLEDRGQVVVIAATNLPDQLDPALRRPGRFDREIRIGLPDEPARREILAVHTRGMPLEGVDLAGIAALTPGFSGADLAFLCREAAMTALRRAAPNLLKEPLADLRPESLTVTAADFEAALRRIVPAMRRREALVERPATTWDDVGGQAEAKKELQRAVEWPLRYRREFAALGLRPPRGILLAGPPGVGKTLLARAASNAAGIGFIAVKASEILSRWFGDSEREIGEIFRRAHYSAPCLLFLDELDAIARRRGEAGAEAADRVVGQLLVEMDGLVDGARVIVLAATNRLDLIDPALLRPGRFEVVLKLTPPNEEERAEILRLHLRGRSCASELDLDVLAGLTPGWTGAELAAICRRAAYIALERHLSLGGTEDPCLSQDDLLAARAQIARERGGRVGD